MDIMNYISAFVCGGIICVIGQILIDKTRMTPARILVLFVSLGAILTGLGLYEPLVEIAGAGATVPLPGFGYLLAKGTMEAVDSSGFVGIFTGGLSQTAGGIAAAILFGYLSAICFNPKART